MVRPVLYHDPTSEPSRAVHWFTFEAGIEIDIRHTWLVRGDHRAPEFLAINPFHQVPAMKHGEFCLAEASAIMVYLAEINDTDECWVGSSPQDRAKTLQIMSWHHTNTRSAITLNYFLPALLMPAYKGVSLPNAGTCERLREAGKESLGKLERILMGQGEFLGGCEPSIADFFIAPDLFTLDIDPARDDWFSGFPAVREWLAALREREGYKWSHAPWNSIVLRLRDLLVSESTQERSPGWVADLLESGKSENSNGGEKS